jgi:hypothetical protein
MEKPAPPPAPVIEPGTKPTTIRPAMTTRQNMQRASKGTSMLSIPLGTGGATPSASPLSIGGMSSGSPNFSIGK